MMCPLRQRAKIVVQSDLLCAAPVRVFAPLGIARLRYRRSDLFTPGVARRVESGGGSVNGASPDRFGGGWPI